MSFSGRCRRGYIFFIVAISFFTCFSGVHGKVKEEKGLLGLADVDVKACEGVKVTQCELAKNFVLTLKMGEDLTCEACFIQLRALGIAPGEDWSYDDPNKIVTPEEMKEVALETHRAYNVGNVRFDGFTAAAGINRFCQDLKGPSIPLIPPPMSTGTEEKKKEEEGQKEKGQEEKKPTAPDAQLPTPQKGDSK